MIRARKLLFVLTDGGRAHFVEYHAATTSFVRLTQIDQHHQIEEARAAHPGEDATRAVKESFMAKVAAQTLVVANHGGFSEVVLAAPTRLIGELKRQLAGKIEILETIGKDLTKEPEHDLAKWFKAALCEVAPE